MKSLQILHFSKEGNLAFKKDVEVYSGPLSVSYAQELHAQFQDLKVAFAAMSSQFPVAKTRFGVPAHNFTDATCRQAVTTFLSQTHRFLKQCGGFYKDFEDFVEVADRRVAELVHRFNHQATVNYKGFQEFETLVDDCMELVNNDSCYQSRIKFQRAMATHMELLGTVKNYSRIATNQIVCVGKAQTLVEFSRKIDPFLDMVTLYVQRLAERDEVVCCVQRMRSRRYSCRGHCHFAVKQALAAVCASYAGFRPPATFMAKIHEYDETLSQVDREARKSVWILEHFYKNRLLPVQERLHERIVWRERALGEGVVCD